MRAFRKTVLDFYKKHGRHHLPWRHTKNPYRILVSEVMLQQTQVDRVIPFYKAFLKKFPTVRALAEAPLGDVLRAWQGLGYNRRAKALHEAAKSALIHQGGRIPREFQNLTALQGVGDYTAKAVRVFAFNEPELLIETNIRSVFIHCFFPRRRAVADQELTPLITASLLVRDPGLAQMSVGPREWYAALMDYGAYLKKMHPNPSRKSAHHVRQKPFKGSDREIRGAILRALAASPYMSRRRLDILPFGKGRITAQLGALVKEGIVAKRGQKYTLP